jgi:hypothetical protein
LVLKCLDISCFLEDYATTYRATRDAYLKAANELKLATGPYKAARDAYVAATSTYTKSLYEYICSLTAPPPGLSVRLPLPEEASSTVSQENLKKKLPLALAFSIYNKLFYLFSLTLALLINNKQTFLTHLHWVITSFTTHSGTKKAHDWAVDQLTDLFHTTHKVKTQQVVKNRGHHCDDIELGPLCRNRIIRRISVK